MWCWSVSFFRNYVIMKDRLGERWLAESPGFNSGIFYVELHRCSVSQPGFPPGTWCVFGPVFLLADSWDRLIRKWMGNRNKSKRKINLNLNQSHATDRHPDGAAIYRRITADVLERRFHHKRRVGPQMKIALLFFSQQIHQHLKWTGATNIPFRCIRDLEELKNLFSSSPYS